MLKEVQIGNIRKKDAQAVAYDLHPEVGGKFVTDQDEVNFEYDVLPGLEACKTSSLMFLGFSLFDFNWALKSSL